MITKHLVMEVNGVKLIEDNDMVCRASKDGKFEPESFAVWMEYQRPGTTSLDIGAYTGIYAIAASKAGRRCIAVEPNNKVRARLLQNMATNGVNFPVIKYAMSYRDEYRKLSLKPKTLLTSAGSLFESEGEYQPVQTSTIDRSCGNQYISIIKIDVEGWEQHVLFGAQETLKLWKPAVIVEVLGSREGVINTMKIAGYTGEYKVLDKRNLFFAK